jgi:hypothetical protein
MTMIELNGSDYWDLFKHINTDAINFGAYINIPFEMTTHINTHILVYDRDIRINSVLL